MSASRPGRRPRVSVNVAKTTLEGEFIEYLVRLTPRPEYVALFREIVLDVWRERHAEAAETRRRLDVRLVELRRRKDKLDETFIYRQGIDRGAEGFGTAETSLMFTMLHAIEGRENNEVSPTGFVPYYF